MEAGALWFISGKGALCGFILGTVARESLVHGEPASVGQLLSEHQVASFWEQGQGCLSCAGKGHLIIVTKWPILWQNDLTTLCNRLILLVRLPNYW